MPKPSLDEQLELWPPKTYEWRQSYDMTPEERQIFWSYTYVKDGHLLWSGPFNNKGLPVYYHRKFQSNFSARRIAYTIYHGSIERNHDAVPACGDLRCISIKCVRRAHKYRGIQGEYKYVEI